MSSGLHAGARSYARTHGVTVLVNDTRPKDDARKNASTLSRTALTSSVAKGLGLHVALITNRLCSPETTAIAGAAPEKRSNRGGEQKKPPGHPIIVEDWSVPTTLRYVVADVFTDVPLA